ncbi:MAG: MFS transporter [Patescibacteria group bacterium]
MPQAHQTKLFAAALIMEICYGLFMIVATLAAARVIDSPLVLGLTGTAHLLARVIGNPLFGRLSDRVGRRRPILAACCLKAAAFITLGHSGIIPIFLAFFLSGTANAVFWPLIEAWTGLDSENEDLLRHLGRFGMAITAGLAAGCLLGGLFARLDVAPAVILGCVCAAVVGALIAATPDKSGAATAPHHAARDGRSLGPDGRDRLLFVALSRIANFATWVTIGILRFIFPKLSLAAGLPGQAVGAVNATLYVCWFMTVAAMNRKRGWAYRADPLLACQGLAAGAALLLWLSPGRTVFFVAFGLFGLGAGMTYFSSMFYGQNGASDRGGQSGYHEMVLSLGTLIGPLIGGMAAQAGTLASAFAVAAVFILAAMALEGILLAAAGPRKQRWTKRGEARPEKNNHDLDKNAQV